MEQNHSLPISGYVTLSYGDIVGFLVRFILRLTVKIFLFTLVVIFVLWIVVSDIPVHVLWDQPLWSVREFVLTNGPPLLFPPIGSVIGMFGYSFFKLYRLPQKARTLTYEVDDKGILTQDGDALSLLIPWKGLKGIGRNRWHLFMQMAGGWRYVPWRAFSPADQDRIWHLAQTHVPKKERPKKGAA